MAFIFATPLACARSSMMSHYVLTPLDQSDKDAGLAINYLKTVKTWLDGNPNEGQFNLLSTVPSYYLRNHM